MRGVNDKNFFNTWKILYRATCPSPTQTAWQVADVEWRKQRHSFFSSSYAQSTDVHLLRRGRSQTASAWLLMVVVENWWSGDNVLLKTMTWSRVIEGNPKTVVGWMRAQERIPGRAALQ
jgi:hypothetical protein